MPLGPIHNGLAQLRPGGRAGDADVVGQALALGAVRRPEKLVEARRVRDALDVGVAGLHHRRIPAAADLDQLGPGDVGDAVLRASRPRQRDQRRRPQPKCPHALPSTRKLSMTVLASSLRAISSAWVRAAAGSLSASSSSITLPARTSPTPSN